MSVRWHFWKYFEIDEEKKAIKKALKFSYLYIVFSISNGLLHGVRSLVVELSVRECWATRIQNESSSSLTTLQRRTHFFFLVVSLDSREQIFVFCHQRTPKPAFGGTTTSHLWKNWVGQLTGSFSVRLMTPNSLPRKLLTDITFTSPRMLCPLKSW